MTLVEMMVSMALLAILVGGVFTIVGTSLKTVLMVSNDVSRRDQVTNFYAVLRQAFRALPSSARIEAHRYDAEAGEQVFLAIKDAPGVLSWTGAGVSGDETVLLTALPQPEGGGLRMVMRRFVPPRSLPASLFDPLRLLAASAEEPWLTLLPDVAAAAWRFYTPSSREWSAEWKEGGTRPGLIELRLRLAEGDEPERSVFWLPPIKPLPPEPRTGGPA